MTQPRNLNILKLNNLVGPTTLPFSIGSANEAKAVVFGDRSTEVTTDGVTTTEVERVRLTGYGTLAVTLGRSSNIAYTGYDQASVVFTVNPMFARENPDISNIAVYVERVTPSNNDDRLEAETDIAEETEVIIDRMYRKIQDLENRLNGVVNFPIELSVVDTDNNTIEVLEAPGLSPSNENHLLLYDVNSEGRLELKWTQHIDEIHTCLLYTSPSPRDS